MKRGVCKHYCGLVKSGGICSAGVDVRKLVGGSLFGWLTRTPCKMVHRNTEAKCDKYSEPTHKEIIQNRGWMDEEIEKTKLLAPLLDSIKQEYKGRTGSGSKQCPACKSPFNFTVREQGCVRGQCETEGCLKQL